MLSERFLKAIKTAGIPTYKIAHKAGITPGVLYKITAGIDRPKTGDQRVINVARVLGFPDEFCFEEEVTHE